MKNNEDPPSPKSSTIDELRAIRDEIAFLRQQEVEIFLPQIQKAYEQNAAILNELKSLRKDLEQKLESQIAKGIGLAFVVLMIVGMLLRGCSGF